MSERMNIEQLVRSKLEGQEITPSPGTWKRIQRRVRWKQFMRFDPGKFNIFYAAGVLVTAAGLIALFQSDPETVRTEDRSRRQGPAPSEMITPVQTDREAADKVPLTGETERGGDTARKNVPAKEEVIVTGDESAREIREQSSGNAATEKPPAEVTRETAVREEGTVREPAYNTLVAYFTSSATSGCAPLKVRFFNQSANHLSTTWIMGTSTPVTGENPAYTFTEPGRHHVTMTAMGEGGQTASFSQVIEVYPVPVADFIIEEGLPGSDGPQTYDLINCSTGAVSYKWQVLGENKNPLEGWASDAFHPSLPAGVLPGQPGFIRLVATNEHGCSQAAVRELPQPPLPAGPQLRFPTAFSPNTAGPTGGLYSPHEKRNDVFHPVFDTEPLDYRLRIYSRRGVLVFETQDIYRGWDGYYLQDRAAAGVYVWMADGKWLNGEEFLLQGDVTLIWSDQR
ncbi:MAG TPA: hypothetical protein ENO20_07500 [Bacteroides sp.]|nr:hypothetical protein [Bacteroides sp.]